MASRYYFNLTDGHEVIRDEDGLEMPDVRMALIHAFEAIEELRHEDAFPSGNLIQTHPLDRGAPDPSYHH
jgi:hypothetical protein